MVIFFHTVFMSGFFCFLFHMMKVMVLGIAGFLGKLLLYVSKII
jgi:hypothetical protein